MRNLNKFASSKVFQLSLSTFFLGQKTNRQRLQTKTTAMNNSGNDIQLELRKFVAPEFIFGTDARKTSGNYCKHLAAKKVLLVTDPGIMATPWLEEIKTSLFESGIEFELFSSVSPNPRDFEVMEGANIYTSKKCNLILALGGGSVMDCAKGIGIVSTNKK